MKIFHGNVYKFLNPKQTFNLKMQFNPCHECLALVSITEDYNVPCHKAIPQEWYFSMALKR